jgi:hypothetical protein
MLSGKHGASGMFTIELLAINWDDRNKPAVVHRIPSHADRLGDAFVIAKTLFR